jgi:DNA-directed RNA polymerase subunit RPC12/RpoP
LIFITNSGADTPLSDEIGTQKMTLYLKACPRCHGDIALDDDQYGRYMECLQCGFLIRSKAEEEVVPAMPSRTKAA